MIARQANGYVTVSTLVAALVGIMLALASVGGVVMSFALKDLNDKIDAHEKRLDKDDTLIVPWQVHQEKWDAQAAEDAHLQLEIDDVNKRIGDAYSLGDAIKHMQDELDRLRDNGRGPEQK